MRNTAKNTRKTPPQVLRYQSTGHVERSEIPHHGIGKRDRETGPDYRLARFYDSDAGRILSVDPLGGERLWLSPYNYVQNNPVNRTDPTGALDDWFVNAKTGALLYIPGERIINTNIAQKAFGPVISNVIFRDENQFSNWNRLGDDDMFDNPYKKVSDYGNTFIPSGLAEEFAERQGFSIAIKTDVTEEIHSQYFNDGNDNSMSVLHTKPIEKTIHNQGYTFIKANSKPRNKRIGRIQRDISGIGWDVVRYRVVKIEEGRQRDFSGANKLYKSNGPIDKLNNE